MWLARLRLYYMTESKSLDNPADSIFIVINALEGGLIKTLDQSGSIEKQKRSIDRAKHGVTYNDPSKLKSLRDVEGNKIARG